ncbi:MAG: galactose ABC transporter substrate-binding protein [Lachnospiraceae bacterium]|nr:galactose ABC transporter substrate-binding protein [Lachnospiraceae bacterium]
MRGKASLLFCLSLLLLFNLSACGNAGEKKAKKKIKIGVTLYDSYDTFLTGYMRAFDKEVAEKRAEGYEVNVLQYNAAGSQAMQNEQVEEMLQNSCDVLCVNLVDRTAPSEIIDMAKKKDVPVIFFNRELVEEDLNQWNKLYYVGADAKQSGILQGELVLEDVKDAEKEGQLPPELDRNGDGKLQYLIFEGEAGHQDSIMRTDYVVSTIQDAGIPLERLDYSIANWSRAEAQSKMMQLYPEFQGKIELILSNNDDMALGVIDAYDKIGVQKDLRPWIYGIDGTKAGLAAIEKGSMRATVYNDEVGQSKALFRIAFQLASEGAEDGEGTEIEKITRLPYRKVRRKNYAEFRTEE